MKLKKSVVGAALALSLVFVPATAWATGTAHQAAPRAGQFCKGADSGKKAVASNGDTVQCVYDAGVNRHRWTVVK